MEIITEFNDYEVIDGGLDEGEIQSFCQAVNQGHIATGLVSPFALYDDLLSFFLRSPDFSIVKLKDIPKLTDKNQIYIALRHDMDGDLITGLKCAKRLSARRIPGSFFILHTSGYYGQFVDGVFLRYSGLTPIIAEFLSLNVELGLHNDGLSIYLEHKIDGSQAIEKEISWLRELGADIKGVVAHNAAPSYGAENFEMFEGLALGGRNHVIHKGVKIPLQTLKLDALGLDYEGNFSRTPLRKNLKQVDFYIKDIANANIRDLAWQQSYFLNNPVFERGYEASAWLVSYDNWLFAIHSGKKRYLYSPVSTAELKVQMTSLSLGSRVVVNIHPEYLAI